MMLSSLTLQSYTSAIVTMARGGRNVKMWLVLCGSRLSHLLLLILHLRENRTSLVIFK